MATRSLIAIEHENGTVESIYCHSDGTPGVNGKILLEHYDTRKRVKELTALGDLSAVEMRIVPNGKHTFLDREKGTCTAYHRDDNRPWEDHKPKVHESLDKFLSIDLIQMEYIYVFTKEDIWTVYAKTFFGSLGERQILADVLDRAKKAQ